MTRFGDLPAWVSQGSLSILVLAVTYLAGLLFKWVVCRRLIALAARTQGEWDDVFINELTRRVPVWSVLLERAILRTPLTPGRMAALAVGLVFSLAAAQTLATLSWVLAMKYREDYARAGLPMLPVTHGNDEATRQILLYSYLLLSVVLLSTIGLQAGWLYTVVSLGLTAGWLRFAHRLRRERTVAQAMRLFHYSTVYLAVLFIVAAVDAVL